jgi:hypothetical protein
MSKVQHIHNRESTDLEDLPSGSRHFPPTLFHPSRVIPLSASGSKIASPVKEVIRQTDASPLVLRLSSEGLFKSRRSRRYRFAAGEQYFNNVRFTNEDAFIEPIISEFRIEEEDTMKKGNEKEDIIETLCRYCLDDDNKEGLVAPCRCAGSAKFVH